MVFFKYKSCFHDLLTWVHRIRRIIRVYYVRKTVFLFISYCASSVFVIKRQFSLVEVAPPIPLNISCGDSCAFLRNTIKSGVLTHTRWSENATSAVHIVFALPFEWQSHFTFWIVVLLRQSDDNQIHNCSLLGRLHEADDIVHIQFCPLRNQDYNREDGIKPQNFVLYVPVSALSL